MTDRTPEVLKFKKRPPFAVALYYVSEIDNADSVTCYGFRTDENVFAKAVKASDPTDEITLTITNNVITINEAAVDDYAIYIMAYGWAEPT